ncbi:MAG: DUF3540 domain-containing protein [Polyangiaceae bacterium]
MKPALPHMETTSDPSAAQEAVVEEIDSAGEPTVRLVRPPATRRLSARSAVPQYRPRVGDRVVVVQSRDEAFLVGVLHTASATPPETASTATLTTGEQALVGPDYLELRDATGVLLFAYRAGALMVSAAHGDLTLEAPEGRVRINAGLDVSINAKRDIEQHAERRITTRAGRSDTPQLSVSPRDVELDVARVSTRAQRIEATTEQLRVAAQSIGLDAEALVQRVEAWELTAQTVVERTRNVLRVTAELVEERAGRVRSLVEGTWSLWSNRSTMVSTEDTSIDGERVLLG